MSEQNSTPKNATIPAEAGKDREADLAFPSPSPYGTAAMGSAADLATLSRNLSLGKVSPDASPADVLAKLRPSFQVVAVAKENREGDLFATVRLYADQFAEGLDEAADYFPAPRHPRGTPCLVFDSNSTDGGDRVVLPVERDAWNAGPAALPPLLRRRAAMLRAVAAERLAEADELDALGAAMEAEPPPAWAWPSV